MPLRSFDGSLLEEWTIEGGRLVRRQAQPSEDTILQFNAELQKQPEALRKLTSMGWELNIPELHYHRLVKKYPALGSVDSKERTEAWRKFLGTSESDPYRVHARGRARRATT